MWCPGWDYSSWALLLSMGGGTSGGVQVFCAPRMCGVGLAVCGFFVLLVCVVLSSCALTDLTLYLLYLSPATHCQSYAH